MKVMFHGTVEKHTDGGCNCKGKVTSASFVRSKMYILPSGQTKHFTLGQTAEVNDEDGKFLLSYAYKDATGESHRVFTKVEE